MKDESTRPRQRGGTTGREDCFSNYILLQRVNSQYKENRERCYNQGEEGNKDRQSKSWKPLAEARGWKDCSVVTSSGIHGHLSLSFSLFLFLCVCMFLSLFCFLSVCLSLCLCLSVSLCLCFSVSVSISLIHTYTYT